MYLLHTAKTCGGGVEKPQGIRAEGENQLVNQLIKRETMDKQMS